MKTQNFQLPMNTYLPSFFAPYSLFPALDFTVIPGYSVFIPAGEASSLYKLGGGSEPVLFWRAGVKGTRFLPRTTSREPSRTQAWIASYFCSRVYRGYELVRLVVNFRPQSNRLCGRTLITPNF